MKTKVYIDGSEGTTGLRINERFQGRDDVEILTIDPEKRKDPVERGKLINASDITFLCLPDAAAIEAVSLVENDHVRIIDSSTAHRTENGWAYGFPELSPAHREAIRTGKRSRLNTGLQYTVFIQQTARAFVSVSACFGIEINPMFVGIAQKLCKFVRFLLYGFVVHDSSFQLMTGLTLFSSRFQQRSAE